jgi:hypothetical protein
MTSSPVLVLAVRGIGAIAICRKMMGATFGSKAEPGTIRGDFGVSNSFNLIHGSDSPEAAERETQALLQGRRGLEIKPRDRAVGVRLRLRQAPEYQPNRRHTQSKRTARNPIGPASFVIHRLSGRRSGPRCGIRLDGRNHIRRLGTI